jgi:hypothetical protein
MCYTRFGAYPSHMHIQIRVIVKKIPVGGKGENDKTGKKNT